MSNSQWRDVNVTGVKMLNFIQAHLRPIPLFAAGLVTVLTGEAAAQPLLAQCIVEPKAVCSDVLTNRISALQGEMKNTEDVALSQMKLVQVLAQSGRFGAAEAIIDNIAPPPSRPVVKDMAIVSLIQALGENSRAYNRALLDQIVEPNHYERARASHIANLAQSGDVDAAVAEVATTNRADQPLEEFALHHLSEALLQNDQLETAWRIVEENADDSSRWSVLDGIMENRLAAGHYDEARATISRMKRSPWRVISTARLAAALTRSGQTEQAQDSFAQARRLLADIKDAETRFKIFSTFTQVAVSADEIDVAVAAARDVSSHRFDYAASLLTVARVSAAINKDAKWRPVINEAIKVLTNGLTQGADTEDILNNSWMQIISIAAAAGEPEWAADLIEKITGEQRRKQELHVLVTSLAYAGQLEAAMELLPRQFDKDLQAQAFLTVAQAASEAGNEAIKQEAMNVVTGLVEGRDGEVELSDETYRSLAVWEARTGNLKTAEMRMQFVKDFGLQARTRIMIARYATEHGSDEEYRNCLAAARAAIKRVEQPVVRTSLIRHLTAMLTMHRKAKDALAIIQQEPDPATRDELSFSNSLMFRHLRQFDNAMAVIVNISDPAERMKIEHELLLSLLRRSLAA